MRFADLLGIALGALYQQKVRTLLTLSGVVIGTFTLTLSVSLGRGVHEHVEQAFLKHDRLRKIEVFPFGFADDDLVPEEELRVEGEMSDAKRRRIRRHLMGEWHKKHGYQPSKPLTQERLRTLAELEHVERLFPQIYEQCVITFADRPTVKTTFAPVPETRRFPKLLVAGTLPVAGAPPSLVIHEFLLYQWGFVSDDDVRRALGRTVRLEYRGGGWRGANPLAFLTGGKAGLNAEEDRAFAGLLQRLPAVLDQIDLPAAERGVLKKVAQSVSTETERNEEVLFRGELTIAGVFRGQTKEDFQDLEDFLWGPDSDVYVPLSMAEDLFWRAPKNRENGVNRVTVTVDRNEHVKAVAGRIRDLGLHHMSPVELLEQIQQNVFLISLGTGGVAAVALLVAALGITNTLLMSVLERTREIGIMKAVGARDRHVRRVFLCEAALIGLLGGLLGLFGSWLASFPADAIARSVMEEQTHEKAEGSLFVFPLWLTLGVPFFACLVTMLAALYPAHRAAKVSPIQSLRHE